MFYYIIGIAEGFNNDLCYMLCMLCPISKTTMPFKLKFIKINLFSHEAFRREFDVIEFEYSFAITDDLES